MTLWWRFSDTIDRAINFAPWERSNKEIHTYKSKLEDMIFMWKPNFEKTTRRRG